MAPVGEAIRGWPLSSQPQGISKCGMSRAKFAQHRDTSQWYELSSEGNVIGSPLDLDFYRQEEGQALQGQERTQELATLGGNGRQEWGQRTYSSSSKSGKLLPRSS